MYGPEDDSYLLEKYVKKFARGRILDIGCGSGILMKAALTKSKNVFGVDIDDESLEFCKRQGLNVKKSDLFSNVKERFDFIIFNPPYLPEDEIKDKDLVGGKFGWETIERFFSDAGKYLNENGKVLIVFSNLTDKRKVDEIILKNGFEFEMLEEKSVGLMERLFVYLCRRQIIFS
ncbi:methyltransferase [Candidatus Woesearchaeota archaeon]|nr:methyltransferase [Candidatus Woesearchaeota archaeon]